jgi:eukaryotic-like serine/threonine-protein kinase
MTSERWQQIARVFHAAKDRSARERSAFLAAECGGDEELRREVESLLTHASSEAGALDRGAHGVAVQLLGQPGSGGMIGRRLGGYELQQLIGIGGMGEVYRARDSRLGRDVAIKILPPAYANDPARRARFEREAQVLASLNHPHIGTIFGVEDADSLTGLVMELVEGEDLSERLARGPLPIADTIAIARQVADALETAHDRGIIHRDLKPANIKVRRDGAVKLLDFGLAKALAPATGETPALTTIPVHAGTIMGTPAYMSPEQARGEAVGREADIWSFGVVLYELLTGASPFARQSTAETLASVLGADPDLSRLPVATPAEVLRLIRRCLEKDPTRRLQHMGDARIELEDAAASLASGTSSAVRRPTRTSWLRIAGTIATLALATFAGWLIATRNVPDRSGSVVRLSIPSMELPSISLYGIRRVAIAPDGSRIAYAADNRMWIRRIDEQDAVAVEESASEPFFSPDGTWVGFLVAAGPEAGLKKVPAAGGTPVLLFATTDRPLGGTWGPDGTIVFATTSGLYQISANGGTPRLLKRPDLARKERHYAWPQFLPDGRSIIYTSVVDGPLERSQILALELATAQSSVIVEGATAARFAASGHLIYTAGTTLTAVAFDPKTRRPRGTPVSLAGVSVDVAVDNGAAEFALSDTGTLVYLAPSGEPIHTLWWVDRQGREEQLAIPPGRYRYARISPDGTRVALDVGGLSRDIWIWNLERAGLTRITRGPTEDMLPEWSRDGTRVFFASDRAGTFDVYSQAADGAAAERVEFAGRGFEVPIGVTPDGSRVIVVENYRDLSLLDLRSPQRLEPLRRTPFTEQLGTVSPDGKWLAYESNESADKIDIFIRPLADLAGRREKVSADGGRYPLWDPIGDRLFYVEPGGGMMSATVVFTPTLRIGNVVKLFDFEKPPTRITGRRYDVSPIDGRFLLIRPASGSRGTVDISVVLNWFEELRAHLPAHAR